jgi:5-methylcytosine-specific restriction endonuclease McrA
VDHIIPLSKGGRDDPSNMQWLSSEEHREKARRELQGPLEGR